MTNMLLSQLLIGYPDAKIIRDCEITNIVYDSRHAQKGSLFVAISGFQLDGHNFIEHAINNGAVAVIAEKVFTSCPAKGYALVDNSRKALSYVSSKYYGNPSGHIFVAGVTGTKEKPVCVT